MKTKTIMSTKHFLVVFLLSVSFASIAEKIAEIEIPEPDKFSSQLTLQKNKSHMKLIKDVRKYLEEQDPNIIMKKDARVFYIYLFGDKIKTITTTRQIGLYLKDLMRRIINRIEYSKKIDQNNEKTKNIKIELNKLAKDKTSEQFTHAETLAFMKKIDMLDELTKKITQLRKTRAKTVDTMLLKKIQQLNTEYPNINWSEKFLLNLKNVKWNKF